MRALAGYARANGFDVSVADAEAARLAVSGVLEADRDLADSELDFAAGADIAKGTSKKTVSALENWNNTARIIERAFKLW